MRSLTTLLMWTLLASYALAEPMSQPSRETRLLPAAAQLVETPTLPAPGSGRESLPATPPAIHVLSLADLEHIALSENPSIARAASLSQAARGNWVQTGLAPNPTVGYEGQQIGSRGLAEQDGVFVSQEIVRGGKLRLNREVANQEVIRANQELAAQQQRVITDVRVFYWQSLIAERQESFAMELTDVASQGQKASEKLFQQREVPKLDVLQAKLEARNASIVLNNARNRRVATWQGLSSVLGRPGWIPQKLSGDLTELPEHNWDESLQRLLGSSPEVAIAMTNIERARWAAERARVEKKPNVTVQGLVNWRDNGIGGRSDGALSVGVPLPIWNRNQGAVTQAEHQAVAAERALQQLELSLQNRLAPVFERYSNALNQVREYRETILPAATESLDLSRQLYQAGETGFLNVLTAQRSYAQSNLAYLDALRELRTASAEIDGLLLTNSLQSGVSP